MASFVSIFIVMIVSMTYGYNYVREEEVKTLRSQALAVARREMRNLRIEGVVSGRSADAYQQLTDSTVFYVDRHGEALQVRRLIHSTAEGTITEGIPPAARGVEASTGNETDQDNTQEATVFIPETTQEARFDVVEVIDAVDRRFIEQILDGETVTAVESFSFTGGEVALAGTPILDVDGSVAGGVVLARSVSAIYQNARELLWIILIAAATAAMVAALFTSIQTRFLVGPITRMTKAAGQLSAGNYSVHVPVQEPVELGELAETMNTLSVRLRETITSLHNERDQLELVIGSIEEGILAVDRDMRVLHLNAGFLQMMELKDIGQFMSDEDEAIVALRQGLISSIDCSERLKLQRVTPSGRSLVEEISPVIDEGRSIGAVCLIADVSESQRLEQLRREYVANISHELRTPLTGIRGMIEPLMDGFADTEEERQDAYEIIQRETLRLEKLVGEMLDLSRLQDGRLTVETERLDPAGICRSAVRSMEKMAVDAGVELTMEDGNAGPCMGNEGRIMQVLVILLDNAIGFTPPGGSVTVSLEGKTDRVSISVRDTGCGIEPKDMPLIWERFYKADRSRMHTKGTGLGLAIARRLVELMGGTIGVVSEPGAGSVFTFELPR